MKKLYLFLLIIIIITSCNILSFADIGPKPSLDIEVLGLDNYYLDLLINDTVENSWNYIDENDLIKLKKLSDYEDSDGYRPALLTGTAVPLHGEITGEKIDEKHYNHTFSYLGVPDSFKVAILTSEDTLIISPLINKTQFQSKMIWDLSNIKATNDVNLDVGIIKEEIPTIEITKGFLTRLTLTILIEILLARLFGFKSIKSLKTILITNIFTQILLNLGIYGFNLYYGLFATIFIFIILEILILIIESGIYFYKLEEQSKSRRVIYGISANIVSMFLGFILLLI